MAAPALSNLAAPAPSNASVKNCYVFKSRLQEYAQKVGISTPVYHTTKEGPSHEPVFKSTVIVNNIAYDSLPGFYNRKAAEQSAAEVALIEIYKSGHMKECIPAAHETGLCKNLLQEYAQKMNHAIPSYICNNEPSSITPFTCTVEIGGILYIGAAARTKKDAEIKAARTALLAIQGGSGASSSGTSQHTVLPGKKKVIEPSTKAVKQLKPKKAGFKKRWPRKRVPRNKNDDRTVEPNKVDLGNGNGEEHEASKEQLKGSILYENGKGHGKMMDEPWTQVVDLKMSTMETDGPDRFSVDGSTTFESV